MNTTIQTQEQPVSNLLQRPTSELALKALEQWNDEKAYEDAALKVLCRIRVDVAAAQKSYVLVLINLYEREWLEPIRHLIQADEESTHTALLEHEYVTIEEVASAIKLARKTLAAPYVADRFLEPLGAIFAKYAEAIKRGPDYPEAEQADEHGHRDDMGRPDYTAMIALMQAANAPQA